MKVIDERLVVESYDDVRGFAGGWSLQSMQMARALAHVQCPQGELRILEFGAGASTSYLAQQLARLNRPWRYVSYENDPSYVQPIPGVEMVLWDEWPTSLVEGVFDLVLIDGPNGAGRARWYPLLIPHVRQGSILVIDDFDHHPEFAAALDSCFQYDVLDRYGVDRRSSGEGWVTWITVQVLGANRKADEMHATANAT